MYSSAACILHVACCGMLWGPADIFGLMACVRHKSMTFCKLLGMKY